MKIPYEIQAVIDEKESRSNVGLAVFMCMSLSVALAFIFGYRIDKQEARIKAIETQLAAKP